MKRARRLFMGLFTAMALLFGGLTVVLGGLTAQVATAPPAEAVIYGYVTIRTVVNTPYRDPSPDADLVITNRAGRTSIVDSDPSGQTATFVVKVCARNAAHLVAVRRSTSATWSTWDQCYRVSSDTRIGTMYVRAAYDS